MSLLPPDNFWLKLPGNSVPRRHWKASYLILSVFEVGPCERGKRRIIRHHSVLFHVASWRGCYWVFEGDLWYVRCSVPCEKSQLMIWVSVHVSALMPVSRHTSVFVRNVHPCWYTMSCLWARFIMSVPTELWRARLERRKERFRLIACFFC